MRVGVGKTHRQTSGFMTSPGLKVNAELQEVVRKVGKGVGEGGQELNFPL